ncbi:hypothetical protein DFS34DRAFT_598015 [Phlyctochytrium arcticum]|nr:hypothetical protein DFS34DRAFT_598015 [Phlyctochytrium arcticum]
MLEPPPIFSTARHLHDIREIEDLARLVLDLSVPLDPIVCEAFERLVELAGSREFLPAVASLHHYLNHVKWTREDLGNCGYIAPWGAICQISVVAAQDPKLSAPKLSVGGMVGLRPGTAGKDRFNWPYELSRSFQSPPGSSSAASAPSVPIDPFNIPVDSREIQKMGLARSDYTPGPPEWDSSAQELYGSTYLSPFSLAGAAEPPMSTYTHLPSNFNTSGKGIKSRNFYIRFTAPAKSVSPTRDEVCNSSIPASIPTRKSSKLGPSDSNSVHAKFLMDMQMVTNWQEAAREVGVNIPDRLDKAESSSDRNVGSSPRSYSGRGRPSRPVAAHPHYYSPYMPGPPMSPPRHRNRSTKRHTPYPPQPSTPTPYDGNPYHHSAPFASPFPPHLGASSHAYYPSMYANMNYSPYAPPPHASPLYTPRTTPLPPSLADLPTRQVKRKRASGVPPVDTHFDSSSTPLVEPGVAKPPPLKTKKAKLSMADISAAEAAEAVERDSEIISPA